MQAQITNYVIDNFTTVPQFHEMLGHDEILAELRRQAAAKMIKQKSVAEKLSLAPARISEMIKGDRKIQAREMPILAEILGLIPASSETTRVLSSQEIPILGKVAAGVWLEQSNIEPDEYEMVAYDRMPGDEGIEELFAVIPEGDSMNLTIPANATLICRKVPFGLHSVKEGQLIVVERRNHELTEMTCKRLKMADNGNFLLCSESTNPAFAQPIEINRSLEDNHLDIGITIIGVVLRAIVRYL